MPAGRQKRNKGRTDETGRSGDEQFHWGLSSPSAMLQHIVHGDVVTVSEHTCEFAPREGSPLLSDKLIYSLQVDLRRC